MSEIIKEIENLKSKIIQLGYRPDELEYIVHENVPLSKTLQSHQELQDELEFLRSFLNFASKSVGVR